MSTNTYAPHEKMAAELVRRGLPVDYSQRAAAELADHHRDLVAEIRADGTDESAAELEATRRLGDARMLVKKTVREYQRRYWCGRWPLLTFLFGPLVLVVAAWTVTLLVLTGTGYALEFVGVKPPAFNDGIVTPGEQIAMWCLIGWFVFLSPIGVLLFLSRRAARAGLGWQWIVLAAMVLAVNVGTMQCGFMGSFRKTTQGLTDVETGRIVPRDTFVVSTPLWVFFSSANRAVAFFSERPQQMGQFLVPIVAATLAIWHNRRSTQRWQRELVAPC